MKRLRKRWIDNKVYKELTIAHAVLLSMIVISAVKLIFRNPY